MPTWANDGRITGARQSAPLFNGIVVSGDRSPRPPPGLGDGVANLLLEQPLKPVQIVDDAPLTTRLLNPRLPVVES